MKARPGFFHGVAAAALLALAASALVVVLTPFIGLGSVIRLAAPLLALSYLLYLLRSTGARTGRIVTLSAWGACSALAWWFAPSLPFYLLLHAGAIWLIRSLYAYSSLIPAVIDLALSALAVLIFAWAFMRTGSVFLATWSYFLVQALWTFVPHKLRRSRAIASMAADHTGFERARRQADAALHQLFSQ
jgi:hypothetical protein